MKIYIGKAPDIAKDIVNALIENQDIEVEATKINELTLDFEAILKEYIRKDNELTDKAKDLMEREQLDFSLFNKTKKKMAEEAGFAMGEEIYKYLVNQFIQMLFYTQNVEEVFSEDVVLRKRMSAALKLHLGAEEDIDKEVRKRIKNLREGTVAWEIEYNKIKKQLLKSKGFE